MVAAKNRAAVGSAQRPGGVIYRCIRNGISGGIPGRPLLESKLAITEPQSSLSLQLTLDAELQR